VIKRVVLSIQAKVDLAALDRTVALRILAAVQRFASTGAGNVQGLRGIHPPEFRLRVGGLADTLSRPRRLDRCAPCPQSQGRLPLNSYDAE
jgi:hypothetical protein